MRPDIVFIGARVAVFVDGCFWHGCPRHFRVPTTNARYWKEKIAANRDRDRRQKATLVIAGWAVVRVWEHSVNRRAKAIARRISSLV